MKAMPFGSLQLFHRAAICEKKDEMGSKDRHLLSERDNRLLLSESTRLLSFFQKAGPEGMDWAVGLLFWCRNIPQFENRLAKCKGRVLLASNRW